MAEQLAADTQQQPQLIQFILRDPPHGSLRVARKQPLVQSRMRLSDEQDISQGDAPEQHADSANLEEEMSTMKTSSRVCFFILFSEKHTFV